MKSNNDNLLGAVIVYFVEYGYMDKTHNCQIEAISIDQCNEIFKRNFEPIYKIIKIRTTKDIVEELCDKLIDVVKLQIKK